VSVGWYVLTEIQAAPRFSLPSNPVTRLYLSAGQNAYSAEETGVGSMRELAATSGSDYATSADGQLAYNFPLNSIVVKKTDAVTGELLAGAAFELYRAGIVENIAAENIVIHERPVDNIAERRDKQKQRLPPLLAFRLDDVDERIAAVFLQFIKYSQMDVQTVQNQPAQKAA
jgi:hypothetical protein